MDYSKLEIKELLSKYLSKDKSAIEEFWNRYSERIYNFPIKIYRTDDDTAGDFFLYVFEKLKNGKKFATFDMNQNFDTWFYIVLRNFLFSMMRGKREVQTVNVSATDGDGKEMFTIESFEDRTMRTYYQSVEEKEYVDSINALLDTLKLDFRIILKLQLLYYFDLNEDEINEISNNSETEIIKIIKKIDEIRKELEEKSSSISQKAAQIEKVFSIKHDMAVKLKRLELEKKEGKNVDDQIEEARRKLKKRRLQFEKMLKEKEKGAYIVRTPHKVIGDFLGITENAVGIRIHRAEKALKDAFIEEGFNETLR